MSRNTKRAWRPGLVIGGKYTLLRRLGEGGRGAVYEAQNMWTGRRVAIKVLRAEFTASDDAAERFLLEARSATRVEHPNIVDVLDMAQDPTDGSLFIVQEFLKGTDLREWLAERGRLTAREALDVVVPIMRALKVAHECGVIHRDVKPDNIFLAVNAEGEAVPKLIDFGISKVLDVSVPMNATRAGVVLGTPHYMSPEQALGTFELDARTDIWSVGIVLYELLAGQPPWDSGSPAAVIAQILRDRPLRLESVAPWIPRPLADAVHHALERDRDQRYPSMAAFLQTLTACPTEPVEPPEDSLALRYNNAQGPRLGPPGEPDPADEDVSDTVRPPPPDGDGDYYTEIAVEYPTGEVAALAALGVGSAGGPAAGVEVAEPVAEPDGLEWYTRAAEQALAVNALDNAIVYADCAIRHGPRDERLGNLELIKATAQNWQGNAGDAEHSAVAAMHSLPAFSDGWCRAVGEFALALTRRGKYDQLATLADALQGRARGGTPRPQLVTAVCRLALQLYRSSLPGRAENLFMEIQAAAGDLRDSEALAWLTKLQATAAFRTGDTSQGLELLTKTVGYFAQAGDARNACLQRMNVGIAYKDLGLYPEAEVALRAALVAAESMQLFFQGVAQSNMALVRARLGAPDEGRALATRAAEYFAAQGDRRLQALARIHLGLILLQQSDLPGAEREARAAAELSGIAPAIRAHALALLGEVLLRRQQTTKALTVAQKAVLLLQTLDGVEEGEALIRVVYAAALEANGHVEQTRDAIGVARQRLLARAGRLSNPEQRRSFLTNVPENHRTLELARTWLGLRDPA